MSAANPNSMEKSMVSVLVVANVGGGRRCRVVLLTSVGEGRMEDCGGEGCAEEEEE
jgi:hypothetical protein